MKVQDHIFASRPPTTMANRLFYNSKGIAFSPNNDYWRKMKRIGIVHLLSTKRVKSYGPVREEELGLLIADLRASSSPTVNLSKRLVILTKGIVCRVVFVMKVQEDGIAIEALSESVKLMATLSMEDCIPWIGGWIDVLTGVYGRIKRTCNVLDEFIEKVLEMHRASSMTSKFIDSEDDANNFVDVLLSLRDPFDVGDDTIRLQKEHIKALILGMFAGGTDTAFSPIEWGMAELVNQPTLMQMVQREIRDVVGSKGFVEEEDIKKSTYVKETLRLHVPVALLLPRVATIATKLQGYDIPEGTKIIINAWAIARDPNYWDRPEEFCPERFIDSNVDFKGQHFHFTPFGAGRRSCPGMGFVIATIEYTLANLLYHFDWGVPEEMKAEVLDTSETPGIAIHKKSALILTAKYHQE